MNNKKLFTPREWDVLKLYVLGYTAQQVADELIIGKRTAETHLGVIREKMFLPPYGWRKEAIEWAIQNGLIELHWE